MADEADEIEVRNRILGQFKAKWDDREAERRVALLEMAVPRLYEYAQLHNQRVDIKVHPEHLEHYVGYLQPRVRAILEHAGKPVIDKICDSHTEDEKLAKIMRVVNLMDEKAAANSDPEQTR